ncbi:MAG: hypothetical protein LBD69_00865 [Puniceicoccales bacterium]|jgi:hypothetical protein|nr:hypothetical protein [Puniceicoccales bacterium]
MNQSQKIILVEIENQLKQDTTGAFRRKLRDQLAQYKQLISQLMPSAPDKTHFDTLESLKMALQHAETIVTH